MESKKARVLTFGQMALDTTANGLTIKWMGSVFVSGKTDVISSDNGLMAIAQAIVDLSGAMVKSTRANTFLTRDMVMVAMSTLMVVLTEAGIAMISSMGLPCLKYPRNSKIS